MKYFRFQFIFYAKTTIPLKKVAQFLFPRNPSKNWDPAKPHRPFWRFHIRLNPLAKRGVHTI